MGYCGGGRPGSGRGRRRHGGGGFGRRFGRGPGAYVIPDDVDFTEPTEPLTADQQRRALKAERNRLKAALTQVEDSLRQMGPPAKEEE
jgi:hypothetical protein